MNLIDYRESIEKQEKGSPCYIGDGGSYFDVKRIHTAEYNKEIEDIKIELYGFDYKDLDNNLVLATWLVEYGITGWGGIKEGIGDSIYSKIKAFVFGEGDIRYSKQNARKIFLNPEYFLSLNSLLIQHASNYNNYLHDLTEKDIEQAKKS